MLKPDEGTSSVKMGPDTARCARTEAYSSGSGLDVIKPLLSDLIIHDLGGGAKIEGDEENDEY